MLDWLPVFGYEDLYMASSEGKVDSLRSGKELNTGKTDGYPIVDLVDKYGVSKRMYAHTVIALTFLEKPKSNKQLVVDHINGKRDDNRVENLRWITQSDNIINSYLLNPDICRNSKSVIKLDEDGKIIATYKSVIETSKDNNIDKKYLIMILKGRNNHFGKGFFYKYADEKKEDIKIEKDEKFKNLGTFRGYDFSNYEMSNYGKFKSLKYNKFRIPGVRNGYPSIYLCSKNGKHLHVSIHVLVAYYFVKKPDDFDQKDYVVNHIDEDKTNNYYKNLEWATNKENVVHSIGKAVLQLDKNTGEVLNEFKCIADANRYLGVRSNSSHIGACCKGNESTFCGYKWKYAD